MNGILKTGVVLIGVALAAPTAGAFDWQSMTSFADARSMRVINDTLFIATSGGLLAVTDPSIPGRRYTNLNGLGTVDISDIIEDVDGQKWIAGDGRLIRFDGMASLRYPIIDNDGNRFRLLCVVDDGEYLWLGSDQGLILFSKNTDGGQVQDAYQLFDDFNPAPQVYGIALAGDSIWLATSNGLTVADRSSFVAMKSPASWTGYSSGEYGELASDTIWTVKQFEDRVYFGTPSGLFRLDPVNDTLVRESYPGSVAVSQLDVVDDSMFVYSNAGLGVVYENMVTASDPPVTLPLQIGTVFDGRRWLGRRGGGIYHLESGLPVEYPFTSLPDNNIADVAVTPDGLLAILTRFRGPYERLDGEWVHRPISIGNRTLAMQPDRAGQFYVGTYGSGMSRIGDTVARYTTLNSTFQEAPPIGSDYVVCFDVAVTDEYFFGVNFEPRDDTRLAIADLDRMDQLDGWMSLGVVEGLTGVQMVSVDYHDGAVAVGSGLNGAFYYHLGPDPFDPSDDSLKHYYRNQLDFRYRIISDVVREVRFSPSGELWVGTNFGISRFDLGVESFVNVILPPGFGPDITAIEFDTRENAWIGAKNGLARLDGLSGDIEIFTTGNSGLLADLVNNLTFDPTTGNLYVATESGVSVIESTIGRPTDNLDSVYAFPNPYVIESSGDLLNFNVAGNARLRIFTTVGELVVEAPDPVWDGRNANGEPVASGVYLWVLNNDDGNVGRGKILLVRHQ